jgi:hypothetical protein
MTEAERLVLEFFEGNVDKMKMWFHTRNPLLGNVTPNDMILAGRYEKLLKWVKEQLSENKPPEEGGSHA